MKKIALDYRGTSFYREHLRRSACPAANQDEENSLRLEASKLLEASKVASGAQIRAAASLLRALKLNH